MLPLGEGRHISGQFLACSLGFVRRQPPPANPFSKPLILKFNLKKAENKGKNVPWIQEGFKGGVSAKVPKPDSGIGASPRL